MELQTYSLVACIVLTMSAELMKPKFVRRRSSVYGINYLLTYCMDFFQILVVASPGPYAHTAFFFFFHFWKINFWIFYEYFSFSLKWDPMGAKTSKHYSLKSFLNLFNLFRNFLLSGLHKITVLDFWNFEFSILAIFFNLTILPSGETKNPNYLKNERPQSETEWNLGPGGEYSVYTGYFWHLIIKVILGSFGAFRFSTSLYLENGRS